MVQVNRPLPSTNVNVDPDLIRHTCMAAEGHNDDGHDDEDGGGASDGDDK